jgi:drug/metabolite transporter (DMT)-like permease
MTNEFSNLTGSASAAAAMVLVGSSVAAASTLSAYPIASGQGLRYLLASVLLLALAKGRLPRPTRAQAARLVALAATGLAGFNALLIAATRETDAATVGVIVGCVPVLLALLGPVLEHRRCTRPVLAASLIVTAGAAIVQWGDGRISWLGLILALGALACEAAFTLLAAPLLGTLGPRAVSTYACLLATPILLAGGLALDPKALLERPSPSEAAALVFLAALVTGVGFVLWYSAVQRLSVERAGLFAGLVPVAALVSAAAIGASELTLPRVLGALTVGLGIVAGIAAQGRRPASVFSVGRRSTTRSSTEASALSSPRKRTVKLAILDPRATVSR